MAGKKAQFSEDENAVLRAHLNALLAAGSTQGQLKAILGIEQQNVSAIKNGKSGFARATANRLAAHLGYGTAELLLIVSDIDRTMKKPRGGWEMRDAAVKLASALGYDDAAVESVVRRYGAVEDKKRPVKWWVLKFGDEERESATDRR